MEAADSSPGARRAETGSRLPAVVALTPYVCPLVLARLAAPGAEPPLPHDDDFPAVVLRTDISGFTGLTEALHARGPAGVEELSRLLDGYFTELIGLIGGFGGVVVKFAGDALMAAWSLRAAEPTAGAMVAVQCARAIQARFDGYVTPADVSLAMRIGIGTGEARHFIFGGVGERWLSSICGTSVNRANRAVSLAPAGQVLVCPETARIAGRALSGEVQEEGFVQVMATVGRFSAAPARPPLLAPERLPALFPHVSTAIRDRVAAGQVKWLAEFRRVCVLFIHVPDHEESQPRLDERHATVRQMQEVIARFAGTIDDVDDEKAGLTLVAAFGLPPLAHEDNATRAVRAALGIQAELVARAVECSIGIACGEVFCGSIGSEERRSYCLIGEVMNRCARLMELAVDEILCDEATAAEAGRQLFFEPVRQVALRGISQPIEIHRPLGDQARRPLEIPGVIGRAIERAEIEVRLARLCRGELAGPVLIEGEPGVGKSTLVSAVLARAEALGVLTLFGGAESVDHMRSYGAWPGIFQAFFGFRPEEEDRGAQALTMLAGIQSHLDLATLAPIFNPLLGLDFAENDTTSHMTAQSRAEVIADTLVRLIQRAAACQPVVLALDDCQWLNPASWDLLTTVRERVPEVFCVLAARPFESEIPAQWLETARAADACLFRLGRLPPEDVDALLCRALKVPAIPAAVARFVNDRAGGHPLFAESLAFALRDAGHVEVENGVCRVPPNAGRLEHLRFPNTMGEVIRARIDRLAPSEQFAIKVASIIGRVFTPAALAAIHPVEADRHRIPQVLDRLETVNLIEVDRSSGDPACSFAHAVVQETAYDMMLFAQRRTLHGNLARWLETQPDAEEDFPTLAHHWARAEVDERAIAYAEKAGEEAFGRFANREASHFLDQALARSPAPESAEERLRHARWHLQLGEAHFHLGVLDSSVSHLQRAVELFGFHPPPPNVLAPRGLPRALAQQMWNRMWPRVRQAQAPANGAALAGAIRAFNLLGELAFFRSELPRASYCCIHGLNLAEKLQAPAKLAEMLAATMIVTAAMPLKAIGRVYLRHARAALARAGDPVVAAYVHYLSGLYFTGLADWRRCDGELAFAHSEFHRFGDSRRLEECLCTMIYGRLHRGEFRAAAALVAEMVESSERRRDAQTSGWSRAMEALHALPTAGAEAALAALGPDSSVAIDMLTKIPYHAVSAAALCRLGRVEEARAACIEAVRLIAMVPPASAHMAPSVALAAEAALHLWNEAAGAGDRRAFATLAARACRTLSAYRLSFPIARPAALLCSGVRSFLAGRRQRGCARMRAAIGAAERLRMPHDAAWARLQLARFAGDEAERARAVAAFRQCGAEADAAFAEACRLAK